MIDDTTRSDASAAQRIDFREVMADEYQGISAPILG
jgi:hypothetical protein